METTVYRYLIVGLLAIIATLSYFLYKCKYIDEYVAPYSANSGIGICSGLNRQVHQNRADVKRAYNDGSLTEYSKFKHPEQNQKMYENDL